MAQNPVDPQESFAPTKSKAVTEEDVRVSNRLPKSTWRTGVSKEDEYKEKAKLEIKIIARLETLRDPLLHFGSAGTANISTSELRVMVARVLSDLYFDIDTGFGQEVQDDEERVKREQDEAAKAAKEQQKQHDEDNSVPAPASTAPISDHSLRTTTPEFELDHLARVTGEDLLEEQSPKVVKEDSVVDTNRVETPPRRENTVVATGANAKPDAGTNKPGDADTNVSSKSSEGKETSTSTSSTTSKK